MRGTCIALVTILATLLTVVACGDDDDDPTTETPPSSGGGEEYEAQVDEIATEIVADNPQCSVLEGWRLGFAQLSLDPQCQEAIATFAAELSGLVAPPACEALHELLVERSEASGEGDQERIEELFTPEDEKGEQLEEARTECGVESQAS